MPDALEAKIEARKKRGDLDLVTLGPDGEWFLAAKNGRAWWGGTCNDVLESIRNDIGVNNVQSIYFGDDNAYFVRHS